MVPLVGKITVYPLKSFDGIDLEFSDVLASGTGTRQATGISGSRWEIL